MWAEYIRDRHLTFLSRSFQDSELFFLLHRCNWHFLLHAPNAWAYWRTAAPPSQDHASYISENSAEMRLCRPQLVFRHKTQGIKKLKIRMSSYHCMLQLALCVRFEVSSSCVISPPTAGATRGLAWQAFRSTGFSTVGDTWSPSYWRVVITEQCPARNLEMLRTHLYPGHHTLISTC